MLSTESGGGAGRDVTREARASEERRRAAIGDEERESIRDLRRVNLVASRDSPGKFWR